MLSIYIYTVINYLFSINRAIFKAFGHRRQTDSRWVPILVTNIFSQNLIYETTQ